MHPHWTQYASTINYVNMFELFSLRHLCGIQLYSKNLCKATTFKKAKNWFSKLIVSLNADEKYCRMLEGETRRRTMHRVHYYCIDTVWRMGQGDWGWGSTSIGLGIPASQGTFSSFLLDKKTREMCC